MNISINHMKQKHLDEVIYFAEATPELYTGTESPQFYSKNTLSNWILSENGILLIAHASDKFAGFSITAYNPDSRDGYLHCLAVKQEFRNQSIGQRLLYKTIVELEKKGCNHIYTLNNASNEPMKMFLIRNGFSIGKAFNYSDMMLPRKKF